MMQLVYILLLCGLKSVCVYPEKETRFAFKPHMNDTYLEAFKIQSFNQDGDESTVLRIKYYNPPNLILNIYQLKKSFKKRS